MKILVTGATGNVGSVFVKSLNNIPDIKIMTVNRSVQQAKEIFGVQNCEHISTNELERIKEFNPNLVYHFATLYTSRNDTKIIEDLVETNILFGVKILDALRGCSALKLFVNFGTFAEYASGLKKVDNAYLYSASKTAFKVFLDYYSALDHYKYIHIVPNTIYGGNDKTKKIIDYIFESIYNDISVKTTKGEQVLDFIHIDDFVRFLKLITEDAIIRKIYNGEIVFLGTGVGTSIRKLAQIFEKITNKKCNLDWGALPYREREIMYSIGHVVENESRFGFVPEISLEEGIRRKYFNKKNV